MNMEEAQRVYDELEEKEEDILCMVSTSEHSGQGIIKSAQHYENLIVFSVFFNDRMIYVPCFGILVSN